MPRSLSHRRLRHGHRTVAEPVDAPQTPREAVAQSALNRRGKVPVPIEALTQLAWPAVPAAPMGQGEVFKDEQVARADGDFDLNGFDIQAETGEEAVAGHAATDTFAAEQASGAESAGARYVAG
jgi:hypothetical protein